MGLNLTRTMPHSKVILLQSCRPAVEERGPCAHRLKPLESIVIREYLKWHSHEVRAELGDCPHNRQALQFGGWVRLFSLIQSPGSAADGALLAFPNLSQDGTKACSGGIGVQPKCLAEVGEGCDRTCGKPSLQLIESCLAVLAPMEERILSGQSVQRSGDGGKALDVSAVIPSQTKKGAHFSGCFRGETSLIAASSEGSGSKPSSVTL